MVMVWTPAPMSIDRRSSRGAPEPRSRSIAAASPRSPPVSSRAAGSVPNTAAAAALA